MTIRLAALLRRLRALPLPGTGLIASLALAATLPWAAPAQAQPVKTEHVTAELVAAATGVAPGQGLAIGLRLQHQPHWHTYWRNPGDSGLPTAIQWQVPAGANTGEIEWPAPERLPFGPLVNFGYEGDLLLPLRFTAPADAQPGQTLALKADASWLVCRDVCVPESATLTLNLPVLAPGSSAAPGPLAPRFAALAAQRPQPLTGWQAEWQRAGLDLHLRLKRPPGPAGASAGDLPPLQVFPYTEQLLQSARHQVYQVADGYLVALALDPNAQVPKEVSGIAVAHAGTGTGTAPAASPWGQGQAASSHTAEFTAPLREVAALAVPANARLIPAAAGGAVDPRGLAPATGHAPTAPVAWGAWLSALALAFAGGLLLNLMPCVFPVLSIKLLGLAQQGDERPALRRHALAYSAGVLLSFLALAGVLLVLRAGGQAVGWGFQLQSPAVVYTLALLFAALGLNLMGVFELRGWMPQGGGHGASGSRHPLAGAFGSGVLAVVAASPCTAPFMGAALGAALTQPPVWALSVFAALGLGMALPYALLVLLPGWRQRLPRPGAWMLRLKQVLAFPMWATVVWLLWVLGQQTGIDTLARVLLGLLGLGLGLWWWGVQQGNARSGPLARLAPAAVAVLALAWAWPATEAEVPVASSAVIGDTAGQASPGTAATLARWRPYSDAALQAELAQGRSVFVDFTAAWCVSCQVNKRLVLERQDVQAGFERAGVVLMRADWTRRDPEISAALGRLGRSGVPVYLLQRPGQAPQLLPEILTPALVLDALPAAM